MKKNKSLFISVIVFLSACILSLIVSLVDYTVINKPRSYVVESIELSYDGASKGLDPNGSSFDPRDFLDSDIISEALTKTELNDKYSVDQIENNISLSGVVPSSIVDEITSFTSLINGDSSTRTITSDSYYPTKYNFTLYTDFSKKASKQDMTKLLKAIVECYIDSFNNTYINSYDDSLYSNVYSLESKDYSYQVETYKTKLNVIKGYASTLYNNHTDFIYNDKSFNDIVLSCESLINNEIYKLNYTITLKTLSIDIDTLKDNYNYELMNLNYDKVKYTKDLESVTTQLNAYTKDSTIYIGSGDNIIKVDGNSTETYNELLTKQIELSNKLSEINKNITDYTERLNDMANNNNNQSGATNVVTKISELDTKYDSLLEDFNSLITEYNAKYITSGTIKTSSIKYVSTNILSTSFVAHTIKLGLPLIATVLIGISGYYLVEVLKKNKRK